MGEIIEKTYDVLDSRDPERCLASTHNGQCWMRVAPGSQYCPKHHGINEEQRTKLRNYRLRKYQQRVYELADSDVIKSLREEIGILRMILEEVINQCKDSTDLLLYSSKIADLTQKIEHLVLSCHRIENNLGFTLDRSTVLNMGSQMVTIIAKYVPDQPILDRIVNEISTMMETQAMEE